MRIAPWPSQYRNPNRVIKILGSLIRSSDDCYTLNHTKRTDRVPEVECDQGIY